MIFTKCSSPGRRRIQNSRNYTKEKCIKMGFANILLVNLGENEKGETDEERIRY